MTVFRIEAEDMDLKVYRLESKSFASGGRFIGLTGGEPTETGTASFNFSGSSGLYDVVIGYFDETDGVSHLEVSKQGTATLDFNQNFGSTGATSQTLTSKTIATGISINSGETIQIQGSEDRGEPARIDYIEFTSVTNSASGNNDPIRIEAETMTLKGYRSEQNSSASGGKIVGLKGGTLTDTGTASFTFTGSSGFYDIAVGYFDETDGSSHLEVRKQGTLINEFDFDQNLGSPLANAQTRTRRTIATQLEVNQGETIQIQAKESNGEPARFDYIEFIPVQTATNDGTDGADSLTGDAKDNTINALGGDDTLNGGAGDDKLNGGSGIDTVDYSQETNGIIANLNTGIVLAPIYGTLTKPKIMPLGDSITAGKHTVTPTPGAYRIQLSADFSNDGLSVDFVGSQSNGPNSLKDKDHEGHPGWTIDEIASLVNGGILSTYKPDVVLLMIGTNDALGKGGNTISGMSADLSRLIDKITQQLPKTQLLVSSVAPIDSSIRGQTKANKAKDFNKLIPDIVNDKIAQGKNVTFVNAGGSLTLSDLVTDGLHPKAEGYDKIGNAWYDAIVDKDTLTGIENIIGTDFNDRLTGSAGTNTIEGGAGNDTLTGGAGADTFAYNAPSEGRDTITDFSADDIFKISASNFGGGLVAGINLSMSASATGVFVSSANPVALGTSANFLYSTATGLLSFDVDGSGSKAALSLATLTATPSLSTAQFYISA